MQKIGSRIIYAAVTSIIEKQTFDSHDGILHNLITELK